jgi:hypothetical protein
MAEERTLGLVRATEEYAEEPSKAELQRRMDEARDSISQTVGEIKETVSNQVQSVKETLDWREQFKKRPVAWSVGAAGAGFLLGYCLANLFAGDERDYDRVDYYAPRAKAFPTAQPIIASAASRDAGEFGNGNGHEDGPGFFNRLSHTPAYGRVRDEVGNIGEALVQELGKTAKTVLLPALMTSVKNFIGDHVANANSDTSSSSSMQNEARSGKVGSGYQPTLEPS